MTTDAQPAATPGLDARGLPEGYHLRPDWEVSPREVRRRLDAGEDLVLLDCRTPREHAAARIEPAELVPLQDLGARLWELDRYHDRCVVVFCHHGVRSLQMTAALRREGFADVRSMAGGIDLWSVAVDPRVPRY